ncbi:AraC family transcriptional regulator [Petroclostridium sp. X23]|uniref:helix-turn-helix domain-containing protein n=1 Tax=Petroclostridium sp. X23 TaxID=3045146 RepID=UPI0024ADBAD8|nr:AraC family transcriptional regulator [Petroclostridium sp. X23]WHH57166.1 AraC family transcriptional regulator [Petroclostridium sp. X23]
MHSQERYYMKNITALNFSGYKFILYYAEILDERIAEFPHNHAMYEIYYVLDGSIKINLAGKVECIGKEQACFLAKDIKHHLFYEPDVQKSYFAIIFDVVPCNQDNLNGPDGLLECQDIFDAMELFNSCGYYVSELYERQEIPKALMREIKERKLGWNTQAIMLCYQFFIYLLRHISEKPVTDTQFSGKENLAMSVSKYIHKHYSDDMSVESVAEALNVSPRHINRAYKAMFSTTFMKNANLLRIAYAKYYLCTTDQSIEEIAEKVGFSSPRILYKLFQQYEGLSISQYRERHRQKQPD